MTIEINSLYFLFLLCAKKADYSLLFSRLKCVRRFTFSIYIQTHIFYFKFPVHFVKFNIVQVLEKKCFCVSYRQCRSSVLESENLVKCMCAFVVWKHSFYQKRLNASLFSRLCFDAATYEIRKYYSDLTPKCISMKNKKILHLCVTVAPTWMFRSLIRSGVWWYSAWGEDFHRKNVT